MTFRLIYRSRNLIPPERSRVELGVLFSQARSNNKGRDITGALLLRDEWFVQVLEGDETQVQEVYTRISEDPRHDSLTLIQSETVDGRVFSRWAMARVSADGEPDIPLIAHPDGVAPAAGHRPTPEQGYLLEVMRDAARGPARTA